MILTHKTAKNRLEPAYSPRRQKRKVESWKYINEVDHAPSNMPYYHQGKRENSETLTMNDHRVPEQGPAIAKQVELESSRLVFRAAREGDAEHLNPAFSDPEVMRYW